LVVERIQNAAIVILTVTSLVMTGLVVRREIFSTPIPKSRGPVVDFPEWRKFIESGATIGPASARHTITVFSDYECPFCQRFSPRLRAFLENHPDTRAVIHHLPIDGLHPHARLAAYAAECSRGYNRFSAMDSLLFTHPTELTTESWGWFAAAAGIRDSVGFMKCLTRVDVARAIERDINLARKVPVTGTPTVIFDNWLIDGTPGITVLDSLWRTTTLTDKVGQYDR
jgi:protein-disulfide isomerase